MAASISPETRDPAASDRYRLLRELGSRSVPTYAALANLDGGKKQLMVVERIVRGGPIPDGEAADFVRDARCVAELDHPNIARIREVAIRSEDVIVASDFVDGERLSELLLVKAPLDAAARAADVPSALPRSGPQLDVSLRILVDVLTGLGALHNLRDAKRQPLKLVHGELWPANVVVGIDGTSRVVHACRVKSQAMRPGALGSGYLAPEVLLADGTADARADVYSAGAILWEMLSGKALFPNTNPHAIVAHLLSGKVARAQTPLDAPWAAELAIVAERALAADPKKRFGTAAEMVAEIRRVAGPKLATTGRVAMLVKSALGDKVSARRAQLEAMAGAPAPKAAPVASTTTTAARAQSAPQLTTPARAMPEVAQAAGEESFADIAWDVPIDEADPVFATNEKPTVPGAPVTPAPAHMPPKKAVALAAPMNIAGAPPPPMRGKQATVLGVAPPPPVPVAPPSTPTLVAANPAAPSSPALKDAPAPAPALARQTWMKGSAAPGQAAPPVPPARAPMLTPTAVHTVAAASPIATLVMTPSPGAMELAAPSVVPAPPFTPVPAAPTPTIAATPARALESTPTPAAAAVHTLALPILSAPLPPSAPLKVEPAPAPTASPTPSPRPPTTSFTATTPHRTEAAAPAPVGSGGVPSGRRWMVAAVLAPLLLLLLWGGWRILGGRTSAPDAKNHPRGKPSAAALSTPPPPATTTMGVATAQTPPATATATAGGAETTATAETNDPTSDPAVEPATAATDTAPAPTLAHPYTYVPPKGTAAPTTKSKPKYEPEGI